MRDCLAEVREEILRLGLPESDAVWFYERMERERWMFAGVPVLDAGVAIAVFFQSKFFPSQRG